MLNILNQKNSIRGYSLAELLIVFSLLAIIGKLCIMLNTITIRNKLLSHSQVEALSKYHRIEAVLEKIRNDYQKHPLIIKPIIQNQGKIVAKNGKNIKLNNTLQASPNSNAITYLDLSFEQILQVKTNTNGRLFNACQRFPISPITSDIEIFMGINLNSTTEFSVRSFEKTSSKPLCYKIELNPENSLILDNLKLQEIKQVAFLVPIKAIYTYYVDLEKNLRYLSTSGLSIRENQPIYSNVSEIEFLVLQDQNTLSAKIQNNKNQIFKNITFLKYSDQNVLINLFQEL